MDNVILKIRLSQESKQWDKMLDKIEHYLDKQHQEYGKQKSQQQKESDMK